MRHWEQDNLLSFKYFTGAGRVYSVEQGCARFPKILQSLCSVVFSCFNIEIAYSNFIFCGSWTSSLFEFSWKLSQFQENEHTSGYLTGSLATSEELDLIYGWPSWPSVTFIQRGVKDTLLSLIFLSSHKSFQVGFLSGLWLSTWIEKLSKP